MRIVRRTDLLQFDIGKYATSTALFPDNDLHEFTEAVRPEVENWPSPIQPTEQELSSLAVACSVTLRDLDVNRLIPDKDYAINVPETTTSDLLTI